MGDKSTIVRDVDDVGFNLKAWLWWLCFIMELTCMGYFNTFWAPLSKVWFKMWGYHLVYSCYNMWQIGVWGRKQTMKNKLELKFCHYKKWMEKQFGNKDRKLGIVHEGYKGVFVGQNMCGGMLEGPLGWKVD